MHRNRAGLRFLLQLGLLLEIQMIAMARTPSTSFSSALATKKAKTIAVHALETSSLNYHSVLYMTLPFKSFQILQ